MDGFNCKAVCARVDALLKSLIPAVQYSFHNNFSVKSQFCVGLEKSIKHLKELFFQSEALAVGVHYMGGGRKTTLALSICDDPHIKGYFEEVLFITVSQSPNQDVEDARVQLLQQQLIIRQSKRTLALLDNVWSRDNFEKLLFEAPGYKTVITTRDAYTISRNPSTRLYQWPLLSQEYAHSLFCFSDCRQTSISHYCRERLFKCLEISIDFLDDDERECFLDLASFPADKKICADVLLDIWVYVRKMEWQDAFIMLQTFASRNLLNLIINKGSPATISYGSASEVFFSQHKEVRDLALYLGCQDSIVNRKRLLMPMKGHSLARKRKLLSDRAFNAQIVSIHTGSMAENQWYEMNFLETEALVLLFSASEYFLPPFLKTMKKLKVLMVCNLSSKRATIKGLDALYSLTQLRSVHLERLVAPTFPKQSKVIQNLDKLSLSLCEGFVNMSTFNDTDLHEFTLDHCSDLEELPPAICHMPSAQTWSVTNCHLVEKLPHDLGNLSSLKVLRLSALPCLKELPASIGKLGQLEYLDISLCEGLKELPEEIGQLKQLKKIDMRECSSLRRLPRSVCGLSSLEHVICDEEIGNQWLRAKTSSIPDLRVEIVEAQFTLDWLDD